MTVQYCWFHYFCSKSHYMYFWRWLQLKLHEISLIILFTSSSLIDFPSWNWVIQSKISQLDPISMVNVFFFTFHFSHFDIHISRIFFPFVLLLLLNQEPNRGMNEKHGNDFTSISLSFHKFQIHPKLVFFIFLILKTDKNYWWAQWNLKRLSRASLTSS